MYTNISAIRHLWLVAHLSVPGFLHHMKDDNTISNQPKVEWIDGQMVIHFVDFTGSIAIKSKEDQARAPKKVCKGHKRGHAITKDDDEKKRQNEKENHEPVNQESTEEQKFPSPSPQKPSAALPSATSSSSPARKSKKAKKDGKSPPSTENVATKSYGP